MERQGRRTVRCAVPMRKFSGFVQYVARVTLCLHRSPELLVFGWVRVQSPR